MGMSAAADDGPTQNSEWSIRKALLGTPRTPPRSSESPENRRMRDGSKVWSSTIQMGRLSGAKNIKASKTHFRRLPREGCHVLVGQKVALRLRRTPLCAQ